MLIKNKTKGAVRIHGIDFAKDEVKAYPDSLDVPKGFEVIEKPKVEVKHIDPVETVEQPEEVKEVTEKPKAKKKASKKSKKE